MNLLKKLSRLLALSIVLIIIFNNCSVDDSYIAPIENLVINNSGEDIDDRYIIIFKNSSFDNARKSTDYGARISFMKEQARQLVTEKKISHENIYQVYGGIIDGFAIKITDRNKVLELQKDPRIAIIEKDKIVVLAPPPGKGPKDKDGGGEPDPQETPWGITRVNGGVDYSGSNVVWIIDTGIDLDHPDLNVDVSRSRSFLGGRDADDPDDSHGHGTHVAGTVAAKNNDIGVIGVAANANVISVRVLNRRGSGTLSGVIAGVDYVGANGVTGDVANMSLGGGVSTSLDVAVINASSKVIFVLAAGNASGDANLHSPARANGANIYTISAMDINDNFASFSNWGNPPIDYCAPGVSIKSCWKKGGYNTISGTSMAAPHASGVLLLGNANTSGTVNGDPDGNPDLIISH